MKFYTDCYLYCCSQDFCNNPRCFRIDEDYCCSNVELCRTIRVEKRSFCKYLIINSNDEFIALTVDDKILSNSEKLNFLYTLEPVYSLFQFLDPRTEKSLRLSIERFRRHLFKVNDISWFLFKDPRTNQLVLCTKRGIVYLNDSSIPLFPLEDVDRMSLYFFIYDLIT